jgi:hypothetical protein
MPKKKPQKKAHHSREKMFVVSWEIFPFNVLVFLGTKRDDVLKEIHEYGYDLDDEEKSHLIMYGTGRTVILKGGQTVLWLNNYPKKGSGVLSHEIAHSVYFILDKVGIKINDDCEELFAYMTEYLTNKITKNI